MWSGEHLGGHPVERRVDDVVAGAVEDAASGVIGFGAITDGSLRAAAENELS